MSSVHSSNLLQANALHNGGEEIMSEDEARRRREQLNRRPSYRMILKDLETADKNLKKEPDDSSPSAVSEGSSSTSTATPLNLPPPTSGTAPLHVQIPSVRTTTIGRLDASPYASPLGNNLLPAANLAAHQLHLNGSDISLASLDYQSQQAVAAVALAAASRSQLTPTSTNSQLGPSGLLQSAPSDMHALKVIPELSAPNSFTGNVSEWNTLMSGYSSSPSPTMASGSQRQLGGCEDESSRKRQVRLLKNREAAKECRRKKKEYVKCLENRVAVLENQNKALIEELKTLKELYCRKEKSEM